MARAGAVFREAYLLDFILEKLQALADRRLPAHLRDARRGENLAYRHLRRLGYQIVARNYRSRSGKGEIDLVGWDQDRLAFIEVKTRATDEFGAPGRAVDSMKRGHLIRAAHDYLRRAGLNPERMRFDIVSVMLSGPAPRIELQKDAFSPRSHTSRRRL